MASYAFPPSSLHLFLLLFATIFQPAASAYILLKCSDSNFTTNSTYQSNRNQLLSNLSSAGWTTGFSFQTLGEAPNQVFGRAQCLGKLNSTDCQSCLINALEAIITNCSHSTRAGLWYEECFLRYSDTNSTTSDENSWSMILYNSLVIPNPEKFEQVYSQLMGSLAERAANSTKMFKVDTALYTGSINTYGVVQNNTLYGLVQCIQDISPDYCYTCLQQYIREFQATEWGQQGGVMLGFECYIRMDLYPYFNISLIDAPAPALSPEQHTDGEQHNDTRRLLVLIVSPVAALLLLVFVIITSLKLKLLASVTDSDNPRENIRDDEFAFLDLRTIKDATSNFSEENKLGEGGFGPVYKGRLHSGQEIAVKRLSSNSQQGLTHLRNEVALVAKLEHKNLVRLLGCCLDGHEKLLVYEYLCNTSLDKFLFDPVRKHDLVWMQRYNIIEGVGRGLLYLHQESRIRIIHRDLKASNILLDSNMNPKISDFGLAKMIDMSGSQGNTCHIAGTYGYMAPEYAMHGLFSEKSDVFSYGVLVLEIMTGRSSSSHQDLVEEYLLTYVWLNWRRGVPLEAVDISLIGHCPPQYLIRCIHIGLLCVQDNPSERPTMETVLLMLSSQSMTLPVPLAPAFIFHSATATSSPNNQTRMSIDAQEACYTDVFSEMEPR